MWNLKYNTYQHSYETKTYSQTWEQTCGCQVGVGKEWMDGLGVWDQQMQTSTYRMNKQQGPNV